MEHQCLLTSCNSAICLRTMYLRVKPANLRQNNHQLSKETRKKPLLIFNYAVNTCIIGGDSCDVWYFGSVDPLYSRVCMFSSWSAGRTCALTPSYNVLFSRQILTLQKIYKRSQMMTMTARAAIGLYKYECKNNHEGKCASVMIEGHLEVRPFSLSSRIDQSLVDVRGCVYLIVQIYIY